MVSKFMVIQTIANEVGVKSMQRGASGVSQTVKIEETPASLRHACTMGGISYLPKNMYTCDLSGGYGQPVSIPYYFCSVCGKFFIYNDFM